VGNGQWVDRRRQAALAAMAATTAALVC